MAELGALRVGLELGWNAGHRKLVVELDYSDVLAALEDLNCGDFIPEIEARRCLISRNWEVRLRVVPRDCNSPADWLAKHGASAPEEGLRVWRDPCVKLQPLLLLDCLVVQ